MTVQFTENEIAVMQTALDLWGIEAQSDQTVEECAELIVALNKHIKRTPNSRTLDDVLDEIADVEMMLAQMRLAFGIDDAVLRERIERKFKKLETYIAG
jgi:NTP pyrophosphatase (non-canonical NTP hydrolase)